MAPPKRKTRGRPRKEQIIEPSYFHQQHRKRPDLPRRVQTRRPINVPELVYRLLNADEHNQAGPSYGGRGGSVSRGRGEFQGKMRKYRNYREPSYDAVSLRESSVSIDRSGYTKSVTTSMENLSRVMEATNSSGATGSENSSVSNVSVEPITFANSIDNTRALLKKKSLVQIINNYIKASIEEGKRQAKMYIRKALSFGVKSGYLIPTDPQGQVIRVSPTLVESKRSDVESRKKRRRARKGDDEDPYANRKERRLGTPPPTTKRKPRREVTPETVVPRKRRKTSVSRNPRMNFNVTGRIDKKKTAGPSRKAATKKNPATAKKKDKVIYYNVSVPPKKSEGNVKTGKKREGRRGSLRNEHREEVVERNENRIGRRNKPPFQKNDGKDNAVKDHRDSSDEDRDSTKSSENEVNQRTVTERRKSMSLGREIVPRVDNESPGSPAREVEEKLEPPNIGETNEDSVVGNTN